MVIYKDFLHRFLVLGILLFWGGIALAQEPLSPPVGEKAQSTLPLPRIYCHPSESLLYGECTLAPGFVQEQTKAVCRLQITLGEQTIYPLYPVYLFQPLDAQGRVRCLFRLPASRLPIDGQTTALETITWDVGRPTAAGDDICSGGKSRRQGCEIIREEAAVKSIAQDWSAAFQTYLLKEIQDNEDNELEILLYLRWFGAIPPDIPSPGFYRWKREPIFQFIFSLSGLNDIRDAIPLSADETMALGEYNEPIPEPIFLPEVNSPTIALAAESSPLARWVPRSCYYLEWSGLEHFLASLNFVCSQFDAWSPGTYPKSAQELAMLHLERVGLSKSYLQSLGDNPCTSVVLAGWDPYFQSGTNFMVLLQSKQKLPVPQGVACWKELPGNVLLLSTGEKLMRMALQSFEERKSMRQEINFCYSRNRLNLNKDERETFFLYLSDWWLTNLLSPRWKIQNDRLNQLDARLRLAFLLKTIFQKEMGSETWPTLEELRAIPLLKKEFHSWLLANLQDSSQGIIHTSLGGLYTHPAIDALPFTKVSKREAEEYQGFRNSYLSRWRQMDPLALQVVSLDGGQRHISRLYMSPISRNSEFRQLREFVAPNKPLHSFEKIADQAMGLSVGIYTPIFRGMLSIPLELPMVVFLKAIAFDFAPHSYSAGYWLEPAREEDEVSFYRAPAAGIVPDLVWRILSQWERIERQPSADPGIERIVEPYLRPSFPLWIASPEQSGLSYLGFDPGTLRRILAGRDGSNLADTVPCDVRLFLDLQKGYMFRRKLWQLLVENRGLASWRRQNRLFRIAQWLGMSSWQRGTNWGEEHKTPWRERLEREHIFPTAMMVSDPMVSAMPLSLSSSPEQGWARSTVIDEFGRLPEILLALQRLDLFISVEPNGLFFETHFSLDRQSPLLSPASPESPPEATTPRLDFPDDEEGK